MFWLAIITVALLLAQVALATIIPAARRKGERSIPAAPTPSDDWLDRSDLHGYHPARVKVRAEDVMQH